MVERDHRDQTSHPTGYPGIFCTPHSDADPGPRDLCVVAAMDKSHGLPSLVEEKGWHGHFLKRRTH